MRKIIAVLICLGFIQAITKTKAQSINPSGLSFYTQSANTSTFKLSGIAGQLVSGTVKNSALSVSQGCLQNYSRACLNTITGNITYQLGNITNASVLLYNSDSTGNIIAIKTAFTDTSGYYVFDSLPEGNYKVLVNADTAIYHNTVMKTYYGNEFLWDSAAVIMATCNNTYVADIVAKYLAPLPLSSNSIISGKFIADANFTRVQGDPIPGIDVSLEQSPSGIIIASTQSKADGTFSFVNVPIGTYKILATIAGYTLEASINTTISSTNDNTINQNYFVSDSTIYPNTDISTKINQVFYKNTLSVYPNPTQSNIRVRLNDSNNYELIIYNLIGEILIKEQITENNQMVNTEKLPIGLYLYKISNQSNIIQQGKLIKK